MSIVENKEIKIHVKKTKVIVTLLTAIVLEVIAIILLDLSKYLLTNLYFIIIFIVLNFIIAFGFYNIFKNAGPRLIVNKIGIFISGYGLINWDNVKDIRARYFVSRFFDESYTGSGWPIIEIILKKQQEGIGWLSSLFVISKVSVNTFFLSKSADEILDIITENYFDPITERLKQIKKEP